MGWWQRVARIRVATTKKQVLDKAYGSGSMCREAVVHHLAQKIGFKGTRRVSCRFHGFFSNPPLSAMKISPCKDAKKPTLPPGKASARCITEQRLDGCALPEHWEDDFRDNVLRWLLTLNLDPAWLAEQCKVTERTVCRWLFSQRRIPKTRKRTIRRLMVQHPEPKH